MVNLYSLVFIQVISWPTVSCEWSFSPDLERELAQVNIDGSRTREEGRQGAGNWAGFWAFLERH